GAAEALEAALGDGLVGGLGQLRGGAQNDDAAVRGELAHHRVEEVVELVELFWLGDAGRVEDEGGVLAVTGVAGQVVVRIQQGGDRVDQAALTTDEHEARQRWLAGLVAAQLLGLRQTDLVSQEVAERGLDELAVT